MCHYGLRDDQWVPPNHSASRQRWVTTDAAAPSSTTIALAFRDDPAERNAIASKESVRPLRSSEKRTHHAPAVAVTATLCICSGESQSDGMVHDRS